MEKLADNNIVATVIINQKFMHQKLKLSIYIYENPGD
ncbi:hypothetical protein OROGR_015327 [Orobanche gracilis]